METVRILVTYDSTTIQLSQFFPETQSPNDSFTIIITQIQCIMNSRVVFSFMWCSPMEMSQFLNRLSLTIKINKNYILLAISHEKK